MFGGTLNINNSTFTGDAAPSDEFRRGGSAFCVGLDATVNITRSILATSIKSDAPPVNPPYDIARYLDSLGVPPNNVINISTSLVASVAAGTLKGTTASTHFAINPLLAPLADNGGLTQTHLRLPGSPALNTGSNSQAFATDQRGAGFARMIGGTADRGPLKCPLVVRPTVTLRKSIIGALLDVGLFNLSITGGTPSGGTNPTNHDTHNGGTGAVSVNENTITTVTETAGAANLLSNSSSSLSCVDAGNKRSIGDSQQCDLRHRKHCSHRRRKRAQHHLHLHQYSQAAAHRHPIRHRERPHRQHPIRDPLWRDLCQRVRRRHQRDAQRGCATQLNLNRLDWRRLPGHRQLRGDAQCCNLCDAQFDLSSVVIVQPSSLSVPTLSSAAWLALLLLPSMGAMSAIGTSRNHRRAD